MDNTRRFEDICLALGWIDETQIKECIDAQKKMKEVGIDSTIEEIIIKKGFLSKEQISAIHTAEGKGTKGSIAGYEIISKIGQGGMGVVYKARQLSLDRIVAIKVLLPKYASDKEAKERFGREIKTISKLNHENIVSCIDAGFTNNIYYYVMEFVEGRSLDKIIQEKGWLNSEEASDIALQIADALSHIYKYSIVHRDIKPSNIIVANDGIAKLTDLGLARSFTREEVEVTQTGIVMGTPYYLSPEQARGEELDIRSDIYSLGIVFYEMLVGKTPFADDKITTTIARRLTEEVDFPEEFSNAIPEELKAIVKKMTALEKNERYETPEELILDLEAFLSGEVPTIAMAPAITSSDPRSSPLGKYVLLTLGLGWLVAMFFLLYPYIFPKSKVSNYPKTQTPIVGKSSEDVLRDELSNVVTQAEEFVNKLGDYKKAILYLKQASGRYNDPKWKEMLNAEIKKLEEKERIKLEDEELQEWTKGPLIPKVREYLKEHKRDYDHILDICNKILVKNLDVSCEERYKYIIEDVGMAKKLYERVKANIVFLKGKEFDFGGKLPGIKKHKVKIVDAKDDGTFTIKRNGERKELDVIDLPTRVIIALYDRPREPKEEKRDLVKALFSLFDGDVDSAKLFFGKAIKYDSSLRLRYLSYLMIPEKDNR